MNKVAHNDQFLFLSDFTPVKSYLSPLTSLHLSTLNDTFAAHNKAVNDLEELGDSLQKDALFIKEQLTQVFKRNFAINVKTYSGARWHEGKTGRGPFM